MLFYMSAVSQMLAALLILKPVGGGLSEPGAQQASEHTPGALLSHITQDPPPQISLLPHY